MTALTHCRNVFGTTLRFKLSKSPSMNNVQEGDALTIKVACLYY